MKLLTKELEERFRQIGSQQEIADPIVVAKFFNPTGIGYWYATEYDPTEQAFFGFVSLFNDHNDEWGYFSLAELQEFTGRFGLGIERDLHFTEQPISKVCPKALNN